MTLLEFARRRLRWSQHRLSAATDGKVHQHTISELETGRANPTAAELAALADVLGMPANRLLDPVPDLSEIVAAEAVR